MDLKTQQDVRIT